MEDYVPLLPCFWGGRRGALQKSSWEQNTSTRNIFNSKYYLQVLKDILKLANIKILAYSWWPLGLHLAETMAGLDFQICIYLFLMLSKTWKSFGKGMSCAAEEIVQNNRTGKKQQRCERQKMREAIRKKGRKKVEEVLVMILRMPRSHCVSPAWLQTSSILSVLVILYRCT